MSLEDMSIEELEVRIQLANVALRWLNSDDPMLTSDEYKHLVDPAIHRVTAELKQMIVVCRAKKVERDGNVNEFVEHARVGLKPGRLDAKRL
jgi:hypothetical protein